MDKGVARGQAENWSGTDTGSVIPPSALRHRPERGLPVRIIVADDQRLCRECLRLLIESIDPELDVAEAESVERIPAMLEDSESPSVVLYNLVITDSAGIDFVGTLSGSIGKTPLVVMCDRDDPELMRGCIERGAKAFLPSTTPGPVLVSVLRLIIAGGLYAPPDLLLKYYDTSMRSATGGQASVRREAAIAENFPMLTPRQRDVLALLSQGQSNRDIAEALNMCENTVKAHVKQVMRKLNADNRTQAALMADRLIA